MVDDNEESDEHDLRIPRTISVGRLLKWIGAIVAVLGFAGILVGYGIWIGSTNATISTMKGDVKDLKDKDIKRSRSLNKFATTLDRRFYDIGLALVKQQSAIEAIHSEIRIRHEDIDYIDEILKHYEPPEERPSKRLTRRKRRQKQEEALRKASKQAASAADTTIGGSSEALPEVLPRRKLHKVFTF